MVRVRHQDVGSRRHQTDPMGLVGVIMLHIKGIRAGLRRGSAPSALLGTACLVSACAGSGDITTASLTPPPETGTALGQRSVAQQDANQVSATQLADLSEPATPANSATAAASDDDKAVLKKAHQLRLSGKKTAALKTLDDANNSETSAPLVKQRGMLALELGQLAKAEKLLTRARDEHDADWRVHSALGATLSARGNQQAAQIEFSKALALAPDHPSVLNNLALSYALDGNHDQAETLLRRAASSEKSKLKTKQNLALILGLNGNVNEATKVSRLVLPAAKADANAAYFASRKMKPAKVSKAEPARSSGQVQSASVAPTRKP